MRYRKKIRLFPGVFLNLSKSGISTTFGIPGASINLNKTGIYGNIGLPGTGLYDRKKLFAWDNVTSPLENQAENQIPQNFSNKPEEIKSDDIQTLTSVTLNDLKQTLLDAFNEKYEIENEIRKTGKDIHALKRKKMFANLFVIGFIKKSFKENIKEKIDYLNELKDQLKDCQVNINLKFDETYKLKFESLKKRFEELSNSESIWDITSEQLIEKNIKSAAKTGVTRQKSKLKINNINIIKSEHLAFHFENKNGGDIFIYPTFLIIISNTKEFGLVDLRELKLIYNDNHFIETENIPSDSEVINYTWFKTNKDGTPDLRFKENYKLPVIKYGSIKFYSDKGLNEEYMFSNYLKAQKFANEFNEYQLLLKIDYKN